MSTYITTLLLLLVLLHGLWLNCCCWLLDWWHHCSTGQALNKCRSCESLWGKLLLTRKWVSFFFFFFFNGNVLPKSLTLINYTCSTQLQCFFLMKITCRFINPIVIAPVTAIVGLGLLEYGFPGVLFFLFSSLQSSSSWNSFFGLRSSDSSFVYFIQPDWFDLWLTIYNRNFPFFPFPSGWEVCWNWHSSSSIYIDLFPGNRFLSKKANGLLLNCILSISFDYSTYSSGCLSCALFIFWDSSILSSWSMMMDFFICVVMMTALEAHRSTPCCTPHTPYSLLWALPYYLWSCDCMGLCDYFNRSWSLWPCICTWTTSLPHWSKWSCFTCSLVIYTPIILPSTWLNTLLEVRRALYLSLERSAGVYCNCAKWICLLLFKRVFLLKQPQIWISVFVFCFELRVRVSYPLQWGAPTFDAGNVFGVMSAGFSALVEVISFPSNGCFLQGHTSCDFCSFSEYLYVVWCPFTVNWWLLCSVSIGRSNSPTTLCHQSRNWMAGSWSSVEWILWHLHWCNCCSVSVKTWLLPTKGEYEGLEFDYLWGLMKCLLSTFSLIFLFCFAVKILG